MLAALQRQLMNIYAVDCEQSVTDYLVTDRRAATKYCSGRIADCIEESVLVSQDDDGLALSVYLDGALLDRLAEHDPMRRLRPEHLNDLMTVLEGISHFNYLVWHARHDRSVTLFELELQAEVDKYVATSLLAIEQNDRVFLKQLHQRLFDDVRYQPSLDTARRVRYEDANDYASRFCHRIRDRIGMQENLDELRYFYRMTQADKMSHIHATAWRHNSESCI